MKKRFYLDTSIWRGYFEDRSDGIKPLGEFAFRFLKECIRYNCKIIYSELTIFELKKYYLEERIQQMFSPFKEILEKVEIKNSQILESSKLEAEKKEIPPAFCNFPHRFKMLSGAVILHSFNQQVCQEFFLKKSSRLRKRQVNLQPIK